MPTSAKAKNIIVSQWLDRINPGKIIDVGPGDGKTAESFMKPGQEWIGVEIFRPYVGKYRLSDIYNTIVVGDVRTLDFLSDPCKGADVTLCLGMLEHMRKSEAFDVVSRALECSSNVIISIPHGDFPQGVVFGNPWEEHVATWEHDEILSFFSQGAGRVVQSEVYPTNRPGKNGGVYLIEPS